MPPQAGSPWVNYSPLRVANPLECRHIAGSRVGAPWNHNTSIQSHGHHSTATLGRLRKWSGPQAFSKVLASHEVPRSSSRPESTTVAPAGTRSQHTRSKPGFAGVVPAGTDSLFSISRYYKASAGWALGCRSRSLEFDADSAETLLKLKTCRVVMRPPAWARWMGWHKHNTSHGMDHITYITSQCYG